MMNAQNSWVVAWAQYIGIPSGAPQWLYALIAIVSIYFVVLIPSGAFIGYFDRKLSADLQARVGPNRAGPAGILQPVADLVKLLQKDARQVWDWRENLWLCFHVMVLYSSVAVLPLGSVALLVDTEMSAFLPFWAALVLALGTILLGLNQGTIPGWFGGIRVAVQTLAGSFPALIALLCVGMRAGTFRWSVLANSQGFAPWSWTVVSNPFQAIAFLVFVVSGLALLAIAPFEGGQSMSDVLGGVGVHLSGRRLSIFRLGRFYGFFFWSLITVVLFLGAWILPHDIQKGLQGIEATLLLGALELVWLLSKTFILMLLIVWIARVNPRSRVDQITDFAWKVLSPFSLVALVGAGIWAGWRAF